MANILTKNNINTIIPATIVQQEIAILHRVTLITSTPSNLYLIIIIHVCALLLTIE